MLPPNRSYREFLLSAQFSRNCTAGRARPSAAETRGQGGGLVGQCRREREVPVLQRRFGLVGKALGLVVLRTSFRAETTVVHAARDCAPRARADRAPAVRPRHRRWRVPRAVRGPVRRPAPRWEVRVRQGGSPPRPADWPAAGGRAAVAACAARARRRSSIPDSRARRASAGPADPSSWPSFKPHSGGCEGIVKYPISIAFIPLACCFCTGAPLAARDQSP